VVVGADDEAGVVEIWCWMMGSRPDSMAWRRDVEAEMGAIYTTMYHDTGRRSPVTVVSSIPHIASTDHIDHPHRLLYIARNVTYNNADWPRVRWHLLNNRIKLIRRSELSKGEMKFHWVYWNKNCLMWLCT
jgi:hypothetical protein